MIAKRCLNIRTEMHRHISENRNFPYEIFVFLQKTDFFFLAIFCGGFHGSCRLIHLQEFQEFSSPAIHMTLQSLGQENDYA